LQSQAGKAAQTLPTPIAIAERHIRILAPLPKRALFGTPAFPYQTNFSN